MRSDIRRMHLMKINLDLSWLWLGAEWSGTFESKV